MKVRKLIFVAMIFSAALLTGCSHKHKIVEATCTEASYCKKCKETFGKPLGHTIEGATCTEAGICTRCNLPAGEPLGHDFNPATCQTPKTCKRCGLVEGDVSDHDYAPANYQFGERCTMCGDERGEKLVADFEKYQIAINVTEGTQYEYPTRTHENEAKETTPMVTMGSFKVLDKTPEPSDGTVLQNSGSDYEWVSAEILLESIDLNGATYGVTYCFLLEDYYDIAGHDKTVVTDENNIMTYSVNFGGKVYDKCKCYVEKTDKWEVGEGGTTKLTYYINVPKGYDGTVIGLIDARTQYDDGMHINDVVTDRTLLWRLPQA